MKRTVLTTIFFLFALGLSVQAQEKEFIAPADSVLYGRVSGRDNLPCQEGGGRGGRG